MQNDRTCLLRELEKKLIPVLIARKFLQYPLSVEDRKSTELRRAFPFGYMKRFNGTALELIEIQLDKRGAPKFVINFGIVPPEGVTRPWGHFSQDEAVVSGLAEAFRLYCQPRWLKWFSLGWFPRDPNARAARVVDRAIKLYPEIEEWFESRVVGPHLRSFS